MTDRLETFTRRAAYAGVGLLLLCALLNVADIATRRTINLNVTGMVDITQLLVMACAFLSIPYTFMREAHIDVDFLVNRLPARGRAALFALWSAVGAAFMSAVSWNAAQAALQAWTNNDQSTTIGIPMICYWAPLIAGCVLSVMSCAALSLRHAARALAGDAAPSAPC
ncbi:MAG: TRAP transporter small permease [Burkholderiales bacterium]|nr:TRAP transporter small permease [Burkholderiales bacterium]